MRVWVIVLLALVASTAGCLDGSTVADDLTGSDEDDTTDDASQADASLDVDDVTADGGDGTDLDLVLDEPVTNAAPAASLSVSATRGHAPMFAIFTINAFDPDGDELFWSLDVNADGTPEATGTELPGRFEATLASVGSFAATLSVTDGEHTVQEQMVIQVASAGTPLSVIATASPTFVSGASPTCLECVLFYGFAQRAAEQIEEVPVVVEVEGEPPNMVVITGTALVPNPVIGSALLCLQGGLDGDIFDIAPAAPGWSYTLEDPDLWAVYWWSGGSFMAAGADEGVIPDGADQAEVCSDAAAAELFEFTLTMTPPDG